MTPEATKHAAHPQENPETGDPNELMLNLVFSLFIPLTSEGYARKLRALEEAKGPLFDEEQFVEWRRSLLLELADPGKGWVLPLLWTLGVLGAGLGLTYAGFWFDIAPVFWGGLLVVGSVVLAVVITGWAALRVRSLTAEQRLTIFDALLSESLITTDEAYELRSRASWYHGGPA